MLAASEQIPDWKHSVIENNYTNVQALAELTEDVTADLDYLTDLYVEGRLDAEQLEETMEKGKRIIEAEEALRPKSDDDAHATTRELEEPGEEIHKAAVDLAAEDHSYEGQLLWAQGAYMAALDSIRELNDINVVEPEFYR